MNKLHPIELIALLKFYSGNMSTCSEHAERIFEIAKALKASFKEPK